MKRKASSKLFNKKVKKQKVTSDEKGAKDEEIEYFSSSEEEASSDEVDQDKVSDLLKPHEVNFAREDPWNRNIYATMWTNEYTMILASPQKKSRVWTAAASTTLPNDFFWHVLMNSSIKELLKWRQVSRYFDNLVSTSWKLWKSLFYRQNWRLPHEIRNFNEKHNPKYSEIVIDERKIEWFGECKRNYLNAKRIRELTEEISKKLEELIKSIVKPEVNMKNGRMFNRGVTDDELDAWEELHNFKLTNDFRELYKSMNGARFQWTHKFQKENIFWDYECSRPPPICFPKLETIKVISDKWSDFLDEDNTIACNEMTQLDSSSTKHNLRGLELSTAEMDSDGTSYSMSGQEDSDTDQRVDTDDTAELRLLHLGAYVIDQPEEYIEEMVYEPICGALMPRDRDSFRSITISVSIVDYLQNLYDMLEDRERAPFFFTFTDYVVNADAREGFPWTEDGEFVPVPEELKLWLKLCNENFLDLYDCCGYIPVRAIKILKAAAIDFVVKVFARAQATETSDVLQADTFVNAAKQLGQGFGYSKFESVTAPNSSLKNLMQYRIEDQFGKFVRWHTQQPDDSIIDL